MLLEKSTKELKKIVILEKIIYILNTNISCPTQKIPPNIKIYIFNLLKL